MSVNYEGQKCPQLPRTKMSSNYKNRNVQTRPEDRNVTKVTGKGLKCLQIKDKMSSITGQNCRRIKQEQCLNYKDRNVLKLRGQKCHN
ncbi:uncharacterized protein OCT59_012637 [Rhizophagus irregularis]|uniref:uncharacterized protein n=1 Tax=Rhizophagus irregularis TaxID=588596 RepID=UPI00333064D9|nr:hypothetical protein OCT59_012637 [Rhizophagus irregularis]